MGHTIMCRQPFSILCHRHSVFSVANIVHYVKPACLVELYSRPTMSWNITHLVCPPSWKSPMALVQCCGADSKSEGLSQRPPSQHLYRLHLCSHSRQPKQSVKVEPNDSWPPLNRDALRQRSTNCHIKHECKQCRQDRASHSTCQLTQSP